MIDLPSASPVPAPAAATRPVTGSSQRDAIAPGGDSPFQEVLTRELASTGQSHSRTAPETPDAQAKPAPRGEADGTSVPILPFLADAAADPAGDTRIVDARATPAASVISLVLPADIKADSLTATVPVTASSPATVPVDEAVEPSGAPKLTITIAAERDAAPAKTPESPGTFAATPVPNGSVAAATPLAVAATDGRSMATPQGARASASRSGPARLGADARSGRNAVPSAAGSEVDNVSAAAPGEIKLPSKLTPTAVAEMRQATSKGSSPIETPKLPSAAAPLHAGNTAAQTVAPATVATLTVPVSEHGWGHALGDKVLWMVTQHHQAVELHLNPPDLGPLKITLTLNDDLASAQFVSSHAAVREAIESAMPRLREMLAENGITLGSADVSTDAFREQPQQDSRPYAAQDASTPGEQAPVSRGERMLRRPDGLIDTFA